MPSSPRKEKESMPSVLQLAEALARGNQLSSAQRHAIYRHVRDTTQPGSSFQVGDKIRKRKGYLFPGEIRATFKTKAGLTRVVAECDHIDLQGMLHIYAPEDLAMREVS